MTLKTAARYILFYYNVYFMLWQGIHTCKMNAAKAFITAFILVQTALNGG